MIPCMTKHEPITPKLWGIFPWFRRVSMCLMPLESWTSQSVQLWNHNNLKILQSARPFWLVQFPLPNTTYQLFWDLIRIVCFTLLHPGNLTGICKIMVCKRHLQHQIWLFRGIHIKISGGGGVILFFPHLQFLKRTQSLKNGGKGKRSSPFWALLWLFRGFC